MLGHSLELDELEYGVAACAAGGLRSSIVRQTFEDSAGRMRESEVGSM